MDVVICFIGLLVTVHKKRRTYMILFHSYALGSLVQSPNRTANSSLALNRKVYMDALIVCSGLLVIIHKKRRTLFHSYALRSLVQSPNRTANSSLALNRKVYMDALIVCSGLLVIIHKKRRTLFHSYALRSLVQSPNRMANSSLALNREVYVRCSNSLQWFISNNSLKKRKNVHDSIPQLCPRVLSPISK